MLTVGGDTQPLRYASHAVAALDDLLYRFYLELIRVSLVAHLHSS